MNFLRHYADKTNAGDYEPGKEPGAGKDGTKATKGGYFALRKTTLHLAELRDKQNLFSTAAIAGASTATTVKVAVTDPKSTLASKTKSVIH